MATTDDIKARLDIVDFIGRYVALQKSGRSFKALCPFHNEKTPSFFVFPERQTWRCFGACATGGDIFSFVMRHENLTFAEALKRLAEESGVPLPRHRPADEEPIYQMNEAASEYFTRTLESEAGEKARAYLKSRGLSLSSISTFGLGLSPSDGHSLREHLAAHGHSTEQLALAGLVRQIQGGRYVDLFRNRLMFPIRDAQGRLVGFGGRALDDATPKYLNTPQNAVFNKGRLLYGMDLARDAIREAGEVVVVEGYMDVIGPYQQGFRNVVASMGTALTDAQVALLRRHARTVVLALDPDEAGQEATLRSLESSWRVFQQQEVTRVRQTTLYQRSEMPELKIAMLPEGKDPDEIALQDPSRWRELVAAAVPFMEYVFTALASRFDLSSAEGKRRYAELLFPIIASITNPFEQDLYVQRLAHRLGVNERTLASHMSRLRPGARSRAPRQRRQETSSSSFERLEHDPLEEMCLTLLFSDPQLSGMSSFLSAEHFRRVENRELFTCWQRNGNIDIVAESVDSDIKKHLDYLLAKEFPGNTAVEREAALANCIRRLEERRLRELKVEEEMRLAGASPEDFQTEAPRILDLTERFNRIFQPDNK